MYKLNNLVLAALLLLLLALAFSCKARAADTPVQEVSGAPNPAVNTDGVLAVLPDSTNLVVAKTERQARNITSGYYVTILKSRFLLNLYKDGKLRKSYPVAIGKNTGDKTKPGDNTTPEGWFNVKEINPSGNWSYDFHDGKGQTPGAYGPWFISLNTTRAQTFSGEGWTGIGIHGTHNPASIGTHATAGCIRMHNADVDELKKEIEQAGNLTDVQVDILP